MSKNKFDRNPVPDSIPEVSVPDSIPEISVPSSVSEFSIPSSIPEISVPETEKPADTNDSAAASSGCVHAEGITRSAVGENIILGDTRKGWTKVKWSSFSGWMMDKYVIDHR